MTDFGIRDAIAKLVELEDLSDEQAAACMEELMTGTATPAQFGAYVTALRMKGETIDEIAGMARVMREKSSRIELDGPLLDTCGTGGDASGSFNVSTCAAFVAAGAGARVAKHGNRAMTSQCGSADVLEALGARIDLSPAAVKQCIEQADVGFMFAQGFHPAMKFVAPLRREIGIRTVFNLLGPLTNPASASAQLIGVYSPNLTELLAEVLMRLGSTKAMVVHGDSGLDELSTTGPTKVTQLAGGNVNTRYIEPGSLGLPLTELSELRGGTAQDNARITLDILKGEKGPRRDVVLLNAAAALVTVGKVDDFRQGLEMAAESIDSVRAYKVLADLARFSHGASNP